LTLDGHEGTTPEELGLVTADYAATTDDLVKAEKIPVSHSFVYPRCTKFL
jgi:hypothetical protein